jgi:hypothetical protein
MLDGREILSAVSRAASRVGIRWPGLQLHRLSAPSTFSSCPPVMNVCLGNDAKVRVPFEAQRPAARLPNESRK